MRNRPAAWSVVLAITALATAACYAQEEKPAGQAGRQYIVSLVDGTSLVCKPLVKTLPVKTSYADLDLPLEKMATAVFDREKKEVTIKLVNGDVIKGTVSLEKMKVQTLIGEVTISMADVQEITDKGKEEERKIVDSPENRQACINNLRQIDAAKEQSALANKWADGAVAVIPVIVEYIKGSALPVCPSGGKYDVGVIGKNPKCSVPGHKLPGNE